MKFAEFNKVVNLADTHCYIVETPTGTLKNMTFDEVVNVLKTTDSSQIVIHISLPKGIIVLETECKAIVDLLIARKEKVLIVQNGVLYQIYGKSIFNKRTTNNMLACGCNADTYVYTKAGTDIVLPFHSKNNVMPVLKDMKVLYSNGVEKIPKWLEPIRNGNSNSRDGLDLPITNNQKKILATHVLSIPGYTRDEQKELLHFMNDNLLTTPLLVSELQAIEEALNESLLAQFMNKNEFYHDKFGDYVIEALHIKKDSKSGNLFYYDNKKNIYTSDQDYLRGYITRLCPRLKQYQKDEAIAYISDYLEYDSLPFNDNEFTIVFKNGILDLADMSFEQMNPDHLESIQINADWDENAYSETADEFFTTATCGDKETEQLLYEGIGYALLKTADLAKSFILLGEGRNGKSSYLDILKAILTVTNYASISFKDLANNFRVSILENKLASLAGDISSQPMNDSDLFKSISAGEDITIERKYKDAYTGKFFATMFFACNKLPKTPDNSMGFFRRLVIIPFNADLSKVNNVDGFAFKKKLLSQESINYIVHKAVLAIHKVFETTKDFTEPQSVKDIKEAYRISSSSVLSWFKDSMCGETQRVINLGSRAYENYADWCMSSNRAKSSRTTFISEVLRELKIDLTEFD